MESQGAVCWIACAVCRVDLPAWQGILDFDMPRAGMREVYFYMLPAPSSIPSSASTIVVPAVVIVITSPALWLLLLPTGSSRVIVTTALSYNSVG